MIDKILDVPVFVFPQALQASLYLCVHVANDKIGVANLAWAK
jgi:hypothetical protein